MSITFGKTKANNFGRIFEKNPRLLTRNAYLNFLRFFKKQHSRYGLARILRDGSKAWRNLKPEEKKQFTQKQILKCDKILKPSLKRLAKSHSHTLPRRHIPPMGYKKRSLDAGKNIRRSWRNVKQFPRYDTRKCALNSFDTGTVSDSDVEEAAGVDKDSVQTLYFIDYVHL